MSESTPLLGQSEAAGIPADRVPVVVERLDAGSSLDALRAARAARYDLDRAELLGVRMARAAGHSWGDIADALGVTRSASFQRYAHRL